MPDQRKRTDVDLLVWSLICLGSMGALLYATTMGIGVSPDSMVYIGTARRWLQRFNLAPVLGPGFDGGGFGPLYPALLTVAATILQRDPMTAARWLHTMVLPANLLLVGLLLQRAAPVARHIPWVGTLIFLTVSDLLTIHTMAWTEPTFLALVMLGLYRLDAYLADPRPSRMLAVVLIGAAVCLNRFAGIAYVVAAAVATGLWDRGPRWRRWLSAAGLAALAVLPTLIWMRMKPGFQEVSIHWPTFAWFLYGWGPVTRWIVPTSIPVADSVRSAVALTVLGAGSFLAVRNRSWMSHDSADPRRSRLLGSLALFAGSYALLLIVTRIFWDAGTLLTSRILAPLLVAGMLFVLIVIGRTTGRRAHVARTRISVERAVIGGVAVVWSLVTLLEGWTWLQRAHVDGQGYNSVAWRQSEIIRAVDSLPAGTLLISNGNDAITAVTGRRALRLPDKVNKATRKPNPSYATTMYGYHGRLRKHRGVLVYVNSLQGERWYIPTEADLLREWDLQPVVRTRDGAIYRLRKGSR